MWDDLTNFHKPHMYLDDLPKKSTLDKKLKKEAMKAGKNLRSQKIMKKGSAFNQYKDIEDFDFMSYFK